MVTGGRGFAARHLVTMLLRSGVWRVRVADLAPAITLDREEEEGFLGAALREGQAVYASVGLHDKTQAANPGGGSMDNPMNGKTPEWRSRSMEFTSWSAAAKILCPRRT